MSARARVLITKGTYADSLGWARRAFATNQWQVILDGHPDNTGPMLYSENELKIIKDTDRVALVWTRRAHTPRSYDTGEH